MKWLSWSLVDPYKEIGGSEIHTLCLGHYLINDHNVEWSASNINEDLWSSDYDVIQTHGSALPKKFLRKRIIKKLKQIFSGSNSASHPVYIHTLHGENIGIMWALKKLHKIGLWKAYFREIRGCLMADLVASVHPGLGLLKLAKFLGKTTVVHGNAWDSVEILGPQLENDSSFDSKLNSKISSQELPASFFLFVGRQNDPVKAFDRVRNLFYAEGAANLVAAPGEASDFSNVFNTGKLSPIQLKEIYKKADALILTSKWEGGPLVALEALSQGCPVVMDEIGVIPTMSQQPEGVIFVPDANSIESWKQSLDEVLKKFPKANQLSRATKNQATIPTWKICTARLYDSVMQLKNTLKIF